MVERKEIDFGDVSLGKSATQTLSFRNPFDGPLDCEIEAPATIKPSVTAFLLEAHEETQVQLTFRASSAGIFTQNVRIRCSVPGFEVIESTIETRASSTLGPASIPIAIPDVFWNTWVTDQTSPPREIESLRVDELYTIFFDLSPYRYEKPASLAAGVRAGETLAEALKSAPGDLLEIVVYPVVAGDAVKLSDEAPRTVDVDLNRFRHPPIRPEVPGSALEFARIAGAAKVHGSQDQGIPLRIVTKKTGCASVGLSIWRKTGTGPEPLDYISRTVAVADASGTVPMCAPSEPSASAGLASLLSAGVESTADAAIHIFSMSTKEDLVLYVSSTEHPSWTAGEPIGKLLSDPSALPLNIAQAHEGNGYKETMDRLTRVLFPPNRTAAKNALESLRKLAAKSPRSRVLARLVDRDGSVTVLPLGLIDDGSGQPLGLKIDFVEALPVEKPRDPATCIHTFNLALPEGLLKESASLPGCKAEAPAEIDLAEWKAFFPYLTYAGTASQELEGLLLLAHQSNGVLSFLPPDQAKEEVARPSDLLRSYKGGAAALIACNALALDDKVPSWLEGFNKQGMSAAILSPFTVPVDYGACFAKHLAQQIRTARDSEAPVTLLAVHRRAVEAMTKELQQSDATRRMVPLLQEFVIAGDPGVVVCKR
ncbi:MAG TPA: hypothetical protein VH394_00780 [Thermoanaerobaculia bacterium]|jgi:hypothetical protein|nr:hypothetical protein [Thermoanaerobaculia bacterium]